MSQQQLDKLDLTILNMLAENARKPYLEISRECGVSGAAVHQRIQRLTANGVIAGSECLFNPASLGYDTCAYVGIFLRDPSLYEQMVEKLHTIPEVVECYYTTGQYDIFIKLYARNNDHLLHVLQSIQSLGWARTETLISFKQIFKRQPPVELPSYDK
jgi:Lrp/AsnC family transcriptional regulator for asnA, asnC and gidA